MMRALYAGVAGLKTHQTKMDVIGNNIANVNTIGYKAQSVTFSDIFYQTTQGASGPNTETGAGGVNAKQIGLGSAVSAISTSITDAGGSQTTNNPFDLMITGDSFFIVQNAGVNYFTKAGNFTVDTNGTLVTSQGYAVMGWDADDTGAIVQGPVEPISLYSAENMYAPPVATTSVTMSGNINKEDEEFSSTAGAISTSITFYDSLGYKYQAIISATQADDNDYSYTLAVTGLTCEGEEVEGLTEAQLTGMLNATITFSDTDGSITSDEEITLALDGLDINSLSEEITIDVSGLTCLGTDTAIDVARGIDGEGGGRTVGNLTAVSIGVDGTISGTYDNGDQRAIAQIAVWSFTNPSGLEKVGNNLFRETMNSGEFNGMGADITADGGSFSTGMVEMSNVDLAAQFTDMITTQRGYQANSRIITVSDTLLEELINLKR